MKRLKYSDLYTIDEFCELLDGNYINAYDGFGYYAIGEEETNKFIDFRTEIVRRTANKKCSLRKWTHKIKIRIKAVKSM